MIGISARDMAIIRGILSKYSEIDSVHLFGSRAKGCHRPGSDVDLALMDAPLTATRLARLYEDFADSDLPCRVDIVQFAALDNQALKSHIERVGLEIYAAPCRDVIVAP